MSYRIVLAQRARTEINEIIDTIALDSVRDALDWHSGLMNTIRTLGQHPERCMLASNDDVLRIGLRRLLFGNYRILFNISEDKRTVNVLTIRHGARRDVGSGDLW